jgi:hypothetical protein
VISAAFVRSVRIGVFATADLLAFPAYSLTQGDSRAKHTPISASALEWPYPVNPPNMPDARNEDFPETATPTSLPNRRTARPVDRKKCLQG